MFFIHYVVFKCTVVIICSFQTKTIYFYKKKSKWKPPELTHHLKTTLCNIPFFFFKFLSYIFLFGKNVHRPLLKTSIHLSVSIQKIRKNKTDGGQNRWITRVLTYYGSVVWGCYIINRWLLEGIMWTQRGRWAFLTLFDLECDTFQYLFTNFFPIFTKKKTAPLVIPTWKYFMQEL